MEHIEEQASRAASQPARVKSVLREFGVATLAGIVGGIIVFAVGDAYANRKTEMRIFQNHVQNYVVACEILHVLPSDGLNVELYDTSVYKSSLEYLSFKPTEQQKKMHLAMTLMDTANALTTLSMTKQFNRSELRVQQAAYATNILQLLSESDNRIPGKCVSTPSPSESPIPMPSETPTPTPLPTPSPSKSQAPSSIPS